MFSLPIDVSWRATSYKNGHMPDLFTVNCVAGVVFSAFGFIVFTYGKRMKYWTPMLCGLALMLLPLFVADLALVISSAVLGTAAIVFRHS
jgi:hypothetical protein